MIFNYLCFITLMIFNYSNHIDYKITNYIFSNDSNLKDKLILNLERLSIMESNLNDERSKILLIRSRP